jgi:plastocyanin
MGTRTGRWAGRLVPAVGLAEIAFLAVLAVLAVLVLAPSARAEDHEITITDAGFDPADLRVVVGEPVTWTNQTATVRAILTADGLLDSGPIGPGEAFGHVFESPGLVEYYEAGNPRVRGTIVVMVVPVTAAPSGSVPPTPPPGTLPPDFSPVAPSEPVASPSPTPSVARQSSAAASPAVVTTHSGGGNSPALLLAVAVVGTIAVIAAIAGLIGASRRPGR